MFEALTGLTETPHDIIDKCESCGLAFLVVNETYLHPILPKEEKLLCGARLPADNGQSVAKLSGAFLHSGGPICGAGGAAREKRPNGAMLTLVGSDCGDPTALALGRCGADSGGLPIFGVAIGQTNEGAARNIGLQRVSIRGRY